MTCRHGRAGVEGRLSSSKWVRDELVLVLVEGSSYEGNRLQVGGWYPVDSEEGGWLWGRPPLPVVTGKHRDGRGHQPV